MIDSDAFEQRASELFRLTVQEVRVHVKIADELMPELRRALKGTAIENDVEALLVLTRLKPEQQEALVVRLRWCGLDPESTVGAVAAGLPLQLMS
ncbi:MAG: hypothetical protein WC048_18120 [Rhizobium sp.]